MPLAPRPLFSEADYLALEEKGECRHEFLVGEVYALAGGKQRHSRITGDAPGRFLCGHGCRRAFPRITR